MDSLILFTGKGGVGKSTISGASAIHHAQQGLRTILVSSDPAHSTDDTLGVAVGNGELKLQKPFGLRTSMLKQCCIIRSRNARWYGCYVCQIFSGI